jgi:hypothetical protein
MGSASDSRRYPASCLDSTGPPPSFLIVFISVFALAHSVQPVAIPVLRSPSRKLWRKQVKNRPNETILRKPRNDPETDGA